MIRAEYDFDLPVPPARAFAYMCNPANDAEWQASCVSAELRDVRPGLASRYAIVFSFLGRKMSFQAEITDYDPPSRYAFRVQEGPFHYDGQYLFEPRGGGRMFTGGSMPIPKASSASFRPPCCARSWSPRSKKTW